MLFLNDKVLRQGIRVAPTNIDAAVAGAVSRDGVTTACNGEPGEDAGTGLSVVEEDRRHPTFGASINVVVAAPPGAGDGDGLAFEVDVFEVGAGGDEDGVAGVGGVDAGLDGGLVGGDVDDCGA